MLSSLQLCAFFWGVADLRAGCQVAFVLRAKSHGFGNGETNQSKDWDGICYVFLYSILPSHYWAIIYIYIYIFILYNI